ncbi:spore germination protein [Ruminiclostridium papyrosolvens DSM 2782]|uniref:Spore germination protein n=1 Tax=Ruminiclostridium papyrosolvens DSM 2782 TaxID=588581 RepID=F1T7Y3_9FIRM|nr:endospore germination permease [Ruminiclostridium papyrosolvens]EGD49581.1 spore germination protein [Ruminiclostridium papyrosolvens DSM 2782]WES33293.1 endospore germination permease [Ruminiclostridium papyrosolvens DSM 2782]
MIKEGKFGVSEAVWLVTITISAKVFYTSSAVLATLVGTTGWYTTLISAAIAALGFTFIYLLLKRFPNKGLVEIFDITLGRFAGFIFSGILAFMMMMIATVRMREFAEVLKVYVLPLTPPSFILGIFVIGVAVACSLGLEALARCAKLTAYIMIFAFFAILILGWQNYDVHRLFPIWGYGVDKTFFNGVVRNSAYGEVIIIAVFAGSLQGTKYIKKVGYISIAMSAVLISISILAYTLTFPYYVASEVTAPMYEMATLIDYGRFLQRLEPIFLFIWNISSFISVTAVFYTFTSIYSKMFRIQDRKAIVMPSAIILFFCSMIQKDMVSVIYGSVEALREYGGIFLFIPPIIALIVAKIRKKEAIPNA